MLLEGKIVQRLLDSKVLKKNLAGVTSSRIITAYLPKEALSDNPQSCPVLYCLAPWTSAGRVLLDWKPFKISLPERVEALIKQKVIPPTIVVCPDLYTEYGGSQYIDSEFFGAHSTHLVEEVFPFVENEFPVLAGSRHRGIFGRSSGGFGALRLAMDYPGVVNSVACHSGDLGFDLMFYGDLVTLADKLTFYHSSPEKFLEYTRVSNKLSPGDVHLLMLLGGCGFYSPNAASKFGFDLPIDLYSGKIIESVWSKWLTHDPVRRLDAKRAEALGKLKSLYIECGTKDQFHLLYGARQMHDLLTEQGVSHRYEEFPDNHSGTDYRYDTSLPGLVGSLL